MALFPKDLNSAFNFVFYDTYLKFFYKNIFVLHIMTLFVVANFKTKIGRNG